MNDLKKTQGSINGIADINELGCFGNIWVRSHFLEKAGHTNGGGHYHHFDHVTLLAVGSVLVEVEGYKPKEFHAPTFIVIKKEHKHKFTALTDGVVYYCVFALRDKAGEVTDLYNYDNSPYDAAPDSSIKEKLKEFDLKTTHE